MYDRRPGFFRLDDAQTTGRRVDARVKWFNAAKGFGFVTPTDGGPDAFLPMAVLRRGGFDDAKEGAAIACAIGAGAKGPLVVEVFHIDNVTLVPAALPAQTLQGAVKWFEPDKGYGFIAPDGGGKDVFVHANVLRRSGVAELGPGQRVRVDVIDGRRGLEADRITLI
jgi:cold shock protein